MAVLAYYTIRSKQAYIFRTNRLLEITGGSKLIGEAYDLLFRAAEKDGGLKTLRYQAGDRFSEQDLKEAFSSGRLQMAEVFRGGGNETVLFDSEDSCRAATAAFSRALMEKCPGMVPLAASVEVTWDYPKDWRRLRQAAETEKNRMPTTEIIPMMPFSFLDRRVMQPVTDVVYNYNENTEEEKTAEAAAKCRRGSREQRVDLDRLVTQKGEESHLDTQKGEESLLAIVHADGNNMGQKVEKELRQADASYDACVNRMRRFAGETQRVFSGVGVEAVKEAAKERKAAVRWIINDGDDVTFICNAREALRLTRAYLRAVAEERGDHPYSSCAGICIFHSHYPASAAYEMAEQACDSAKKALRSTGKRDGSWIDFHYVHSGLSEDLDLIRREQNTGGRMARPYTVGQEKEGPDVRALDRIADILKDERVTRSNVKAFGSAWEEETAAGQAEFRRICARAPRLRGKLGEIEPDEDRLLRVLYDLSEVYDLWYAEGRK